jgi:Flp pilus assembly protein TadG
MEYPSRTIQRRSRLRQRRRGAAVVEFAICLPVLLLIAMWTVECCYMIQLRHSLAIAAYEGARTATLKGATNTDASDAAQAVMTARKVCNGTVTVNPADIQQAAIGSYITVTTQAATSDSETFDGTVYNNHIFPLTNNTITVSVQMMKEY